MRSDSSTISRSIFLRKEHSVRKQFSRLMSNIIQGETKRSTPLILCLDEARLEGSRGGPKGSKFNKKHVELSSLYTETTM